MNGFLSIINQCKELDYYCWKKKKKENLYNYLSSYRNEQCEIKNSSDYNVRTIFLGNILYAASLSLIGNLKSSRKKTRPEIERITIRRLESKFQSNEYSSWKHKLSLSPWPNFNFNGQRQGKEKHLRMSRRILARQRVTVAVDVVSQPKGRSTAEANTVTNCLSTVSMRQLINPQ